MTGHKFKDDYMSYQNNITLSNEARTKMKEAIASGEKPAEVIPFPAANEGSSPASKKAKRPFKARWVAIPAACAALALTCVLALPALAPVDSDFSVVAYGEGGAIEDDGSIRFSVAEFVALLDNEETHEVWFIYGSRFGVEAQDAEWVEVSTSKGEVFDSSTLYPDMAQVDLGETLRVSPGTEVNGLTKTRFGFCLNLTALSPDEGAETFVERIGYDNMLTLLEGATLEITVGFKDGSEVSKKYELKTEYVELTKEDYELEGSEEAFLEDESIVYLPTLVGTLIEE